MKMCYIYKTTNMINNKFYIGQSINLSSSYLGSGKILKLAILKYGKKKFKKEIIEVCTESELNDREIYWIKKLKPYYNIDGGGYNRAKETGDAISKANKGNIPWNKGLTKKTDKRVFDYSKKISKTKKITSVGCGNSFYGKKHSKHSKKLIGDKNKKYARIRNLLMTKQEKRLKYGLFGKDNYGYIKREIRECVCGCRNYFECKINSNKKFYKAGHVGIGRKHSQRTINKRIKSLKRFYRNKNKKIK